MKHKRILSALLAAAICLTSLPLNASVDPSAVLTAGAEELIYADEGLTYEAVDGEISITGYTKDMFTYVVIPAQIGGMPVTGIADEAFCDCKTICSITIPESVTSIGWGAFYNTPWLQARQEEDPLVIAGSVLIDGKGCAGGSTGRKHR